MEIYVESDKWNTIFFRIFVQKTVQRDLKLHWAAEKMFFDQLSMIEICTRVDKILLYTFWGQYTQFWKQSY